MYSSVTIVGNVGRDPEQRIVGEGSHKTVTFSMAVSVYRNKQQETQWYRITCWGRTADTALSYVKKGRQILVSGSLFASAYINNAGEAAINLEVNAEKLILLGKRDDLADMGNNDDNNDGPPPDLNDIPF